MVVVVVRAYLSGLISDLREERGSDGLECSHHHLQLQTSCCSDSSQIKKHIKKVLNYLGAVASEQVDVAALVSTSAPSFAVNMYV